jgi:hypothetical protein
MLLFIGLSSRELVRVRSEFALITQRSEVQILPPQSENTKSGHRKVAFFVGLARMSVFLIV